MKWIFERLDGTAPAVDTPVDHVSARGAIDLSGLSKSQESMEELLRVDPDELREELVAIRKHYNRPGDRLPQELWKKVRAFKQRLG